MSLSCAALTNASTRTSCGVGSRSKAARSPATSARFARSLSAETKTAAARSQPTASARSWRTRHATTPPASRVDAHRAAWESPSPSRSALPRFSRNLAGAPRPRSRARAGGAAAVLLSRAQALFSSHLELVVLFLPSVVVIPTLCSPFLLGFGLLLRRRVEAFSSREHLVRGRDPRVARARVGQDEVEGLALAYDAQAGLAFRLHRDRRRGRVGVLDRARADGAPREPRLVLRQPQVDLLAGKSELLRAFDADLWKVRGSGRSFEGLASPNAPSTPPCAFARADRVAPAWPNPRSSKGPRSDCPYRRSTCGGGYGWPIGSPPRWMLKSTLCFYVRRRLWMAHRRPPR